MGSATSLPLSDEVEVGQKRTTEAGITAWKVGGNRDADEGEEGASLDFLSLYRLLDVCLLLFPSLSAENAERTLLKEVKGGKNGGGEGEK